MCKVDHTEKVSKVQVPQHEVLEYMDLVAFQQEQKAQRSRRQERAGDQTYSAALRRPVGLMGLFKKLLLAL